MTTKNPVALVTGASTGIGAAYVRLLAQKGYDVVLLARDQVKLQAVADDVVAQYAVQAYICVQDLSDPEAVANVWAFTESRQLTIDLLINNAGYGDVGPFLDHSLAEHKAMLDAMLYAIIALTHAYLPGMVARGQGGVVNVASVVGLLGPALKSNIKRALYRPIKSFIIAFTEQLVIAYGQSGVSLQCLCPGLTVSSFHERSQQSHLYQTIPAMFWLSSEQVAEKSFKALPKKRVVVVTGWINRLVITVSRLIGLVY